MLTANKLSSKPGDSTATAPFADYLHWLERRTMIDDPDIERYEIHSSI